MSIPIPAWAPRVPITLQTQTTTTGATGTPTKGYAPSGTTFEGTWQPVSSQDAVKAGRSGSKLMREIWTEDAAASAVNNGSVLGMDGKNWAVVNIEKFPGDPVYYFLVEAIQ